MEQLCQFCEEPLVGYTKVARFHKECATFWRWYKRPKREIEIKQPFPCLYCGKIVSRGEKEQMQSWAKRKYCCKSCAAFAKQVNLRKFVPPPQEVTDEKIGVRRYIPGTPEFEAIAALYL